eukprot:Skav220560  [mRNA]  locus=scaffold761:338151:338561:+ [translate_table: standard]
MFCNALPVLQICGRQLPSPTAIYARREALTTEIRNKLAEGREVALQQQLSRQQEQLEALQKQHLGSDNNFEK